MFLIQQFQTVETRTLPALEYLLWQRLALVLYELAQGVVTVPTRVEPNDFGQKVTPFEGIARGHEVEEKAVGGYHSTTLCNTAGY